MFSVGGFFCFRVLFEWKCAQNREKLTLNSQVHANNNLLVLQTNSSSCFIFILCPRQIIV